MLDCTNIAFSGSAKDCATATIDFAFDGATSIATAPARDSIQHAVKNESIVGLAIGESLRRLGVNDQAIQEILEHIGVPIAVWEGENLVEDIYNGVVVGETASEALR